MQRRKRRGCRVRGLSDAGQRGCLCLSASLFFSLSFLCFFLCFLFHISYLMVAWILFVCPGDTRRASANAGDARPRDVTGFFRFFGSGPNLLCAPVTKNVAGSALDWNPDRTLFKFLGHRAQIGKDSCLGVQAEGATGDSPAPLRVPLRPGASEVLPRRFGGLPEVLPQRRCLVCSVAAPSPSALCLFAWRLFF
jgi:hypothetical protein